MELHIDASNIIRGGGRTHLIELLRNGRPESYGFNKIFLYGHRTVLDLIPPTPWLERASHPLFNYGYLGRWVWQVFCRTKQENGIWFVPGAGTAPGRYVTMCQNLLPLETKERDRYFFSLTWVRLVILGWLHRRAFKNAAGVIFFNQHCLSVLSERDQKRIVNRAFIPHGVSESFNVQSTNHRAHDSLRLIYVSTIDEYKHQWKIAHAVENLINERYKIEIDFVGTANPISLKKLVPYLSDSIRYHDAVSYSTLPKWYSGADAFIFGSTCETFGMVLLEAMACGLPVLCSDRSSMPETLGEHAIYFDPTAVLSIQQAIIKIYKNQTLIEHLRQKGINYVKKFTWAKTSQETFKFIQDCCLTKV